MASFLISPKGYAGEPLQPPVKMFPVTAIPVKGWHHADDKCLCHKSATVLIKTEIWPRIPQGNPYWEGQFGSTLSSAWGKKVFPSLIMYTHLSDLPAPDRVSVEPLLWESKICRVCSLPYRSMAASQIMIPWDRDCVFWSHSILCHKRRASPTRTNILTQKKNCLKSRPKRAPVAHTLVLATQKAEIRSTGLKPVGQIVCKILSQDNPSQKKGWWKGSRFRLWVQALVSQKN
jgi:hypothetical protein